MINPHEQHQRIAKLGLSLGVPTLFVVVVASRPNNYTFRIYNPNLISIAHIIAPILPPSFTEGSTQLELKISTGKSVADALNRICVWINAALEIPAHDQNRVIWKIL